jgi:hypothetical protein
MHSPDLKFGPVHGKYSIYIFEFFNEDRRLGHASEQNWGIMFSKLYTLSFEDVCITISESPALHGTFCVAIKCTKA